VLRVNSEFTRVFGYNPQEAIGRRLEGLIVPDEARDEFHKHTELVATRGQRVDAEGVRQRKDGSILHTSILRLPVALPGGQSVLYAIFRDITERKRAEEELRRSEAYLAEGQRLAHTGSWAYNPSGFFDHWSQEMFHIYGFDPAKGAPNLAEYLGTAHPEDREFIAGTIEEMVAQGVGCDIRKRILRLGGEVRILRCVGVPVFDNGILKSIVGTAMDVTEQEELTQALQLSFKKLRALAARLQVIREEERSRVAREIHDELGQALTAIKIDLTSLLRAASTGKGVEARRSESILKLLDETIQSVRRIATELRPVVLDELGLVAAVEWATEEFQARTGTKCRLDLPQADVVIDPERATALFRIFQETLTNVARHANASEVNVRLAKEDRNLILEVHDNGTGASKEQLAATNSLGILGMRESALLLGGELTIFGAAGEGTTVIARIPEAHPTRPEEGK